MDTSFPADKARQGAREGGKREVVRDSLVYRDRVQTVTVEVEKELTWWQRFRLSLGNIFFALIVIAILYLLSLLFNNFLKLKR